MLASAVLLAIQCAQVWFGWSGATTARAYAVILPLNIVATLAFPGGKATVVRFVQRWVVNPPVRLLLHLGVMPLGYALLETRGRSSGRLRRTPVGNGRQGEVFWIIAEHGRRAGYVRNIVREPHVRIRMRVGLRFRWVDGFATIRPDLDPLAVQRGLAAWHPLRAFNAVQVQVLGSDLLVVRVDLETSLPTSASMRRRHSSAAAPRTTAAHRERLRRAAGDATRRGMLQKSETQSWDCAVSATRTMSRFSATSRTSPAGASWLAASQASVASSSDWSDRAIG